MTARMVPRASLSSSVGATVGTNLSASGLDQTLSGFAGSPLSMVSHQITDVANGASIIMTSSCPVWCNLDTMAHLDMTSRGVATGSTTERNGPSAWRKFSAAMAGMLPSTLLKIVCSASLDKASTETTCKVKRLVLTNTEQLFRP